MARDFKIIGIAIGVGGIATFVSIAYLDRELADFFHQNVHGIGILASLVETPKLIVGLSLLWIASTLVANRANFLIPYWLNSARYPAISVLASVPIIYFLKWVFGRSRPTSLNRPIGSYISDGTYEFSPFMNDFAHQSFPSGHITVMAAFAAAIILSRPRLWPLGPILILPVGAGLLALNFHFLSDMIAGTLVGILVAIGSRLYLPKVQPARHLRSGADGNE